MAELKMNIADLEAFMAREFPQAAQVDTAIERLADGPIGPSDLSLGAVE
jgi:hypothetical protein